MNTVMSTAMYIYHNHNLYWPSMLTHMGISLSVLSSFQYTCIQILQDIKLNKYSISKHKHITVICKRCLYTGHITTTVYTGLCTSRLVQVCMTMRK